MLNIGSPTDTKQRASIEITEMIALCRLVPGIL